MAEYNQIRAEIHNWSLESDDRLFRKVEMFAQNFLNKVDYITADVKNTDFNINSNHVELGNAFSKFLNLSNHKFTENKMQPFNDADLLRKSQIESSDLIPLSMDSNSNIVERYQQALNFGMENINITQYLNQTNDDDDRLSVSDAGERSYSIYSEGSVLPGKNNKLPYIINTRAFLEDDYIGIYENPEQPIKPEILSFQEISLPESNIKVETNYIPKIEQPPPPPPNQQVDNSKPESNINENNVPPPPQLLGNTNGVIVNQGAPPPPPNLLLPGIKPGNNPPPFIPPPLPNLNSQPQSNVPPPIQQGGAKILAPPPLNLLLQNQAQGKKTEFNPPTNQNTANYPQLNNNQNPSQMPPPIFGTPNQNMEETTNKNPEPLSFKDQLQAMLGRSRQAPAQPQDQQNNMGNPQMNIQPPPNNQYMENMQPQNNMMNNNIGNSMMGNPMMGNPMMSNPMMGNPMMGNPMMGNPMMSNPMMGNQMNIGGQQNNPYMTPQQMGGPQGFQNNLNIGSGGMNQNLVGSQSQTSYNYRLSDSQMPLVDFSQPINPNQNYYSIPQNNQQPQNYNNYQNMPSQNFQQMPPQQQQVTKTQNQPLPPTGTVNVNVNKKAPPPPNLLTLIEKEKSEKNSKQPSPVKTKQQTPQMQSNPGMQQNPAPTNFQQPQMPTQQPIQGLSFQEQLMAQLKQKQQKSTDPQPNPTITQSTPYQQPSNQNWQNNSQSTQPNFNQTPNRENSQFRESIKALQASQENPNVSQTTNQEENSGAQSRANLKAQLERTLMAQRGFNPVVPDRTQTQTDNTGITNTNDQPQPQTNLVVPTRPSLKSSRSVDVDRLESKYKPKKNKGNNLFDDNDEESGSDKDNIFAGEKRRNTKFEDLLKKPITITPDPPQEKPKTEIPRPQIIEPEKNLVLEPTNFTVSQLNAKKIEDSFMVTKTNDVMKDKQDLLEKSKVPELNKQGKFSKLFGNDSDEEDESKKTEDMNKLYAKEKLKRSATALPSSISHSKANNSKAAALFKDNDSDDDKAFNLSKPVTKPILKEKKVIENDGDYEEKLNVPKRTLEKKASVKFKLDDEIDDNQEKQRSDEKMKKTLFNDLDEDEPPKPKKEDLQPKEKPMFNPLENKPAKKIEEVVNPLTKKPLLFEEESSENIVLPKKIEKTMGENRPSQKSNLFGDEAHGNETENRNSKKPQLTFLDEPKKIDVEEDQSSKKTPLGYFDESKNDNPMEENRPSKKNPNTFLEEPKKFESPLENRPSKKSPLDFLNENEKSGKIIEENLPSKKSPLGFLDEPSEALGSKKQPVFEDFKPNQSNPSRPSQKQLFSENLDESSEALGMVKTRASEKTFEETSEKKTNPIVSSDLRPSKKPLDFFDEPSESLTFEKSKPVEKTTQLSGTASKQTSNKNALAFLDESSEALPVEKPKNTYVDYNLQKPMGSPPQKTSIDATFQKPTESPPKSRDIFGNERTLNAEPSKEKDIFGKSNKKALDFLDESSEALGIAKSKSEIPPNEAKKQEEEPVVKSRTLKFPDPTEKKLIESYQGDNNLGLKPNVESKPLLTRPSERNENIDAVRPSTSIKDRFPPPKQTEQKEPNIDVIRPSTSIKDRFPPAKQEETKDTNTNTIRPSTSIKDRFPPAKQDEKKEQENQDFQTKKSSKTVTSSRIQGLQDKLGNLPLGGMFQKPEDRVVLNPRRMKKDDDRRPELDHDLTMDKPTIGRKKKPRGQQNADFKEADVDENLKFERQNNAIVHHPEEENVQNAQDMPSEQTLGSTRNSKQRMFEDEKTNDTFMSNQMKPALPNLNDFPTKKAKNVFDDSEETSNFNIRPSNQNKSVPPTLPKTEVPKKPAKKLSDDPDDIPNPLSFKSQQQTPVPKLPDLSNDRLDRPSKREKDPPKVEKVSIGQQPPLLPDLSEDKHDKKKKKHPLDRPSEKNAEDKKKKMFEEEENEPLPKTSLTKGNTSKANNDGVPALPGKVESKSVLPDFKAPTFVAKPGEKESKKLKKLFDDDDDDDGGTLFKPKVENRSTYGNTGGVSGKKKNIFGD